MIVHSGRGGGYTTQLFFEILSSDKDIIVWCRRPEILISNFCKLFPTFIKEKYERKVILIDNRVIQFFDNR